MIVQEDVPYTKEEVKAMVKTIHDLRNQLNQLRKANSLFSLSEVEPIADIDWGQIHVQAAIAAMQGMIANPQTFEQLDHDKGYKEIRGGDKSQIIAIASVMYADALIAELKKGGQ